MPLESRLTEIEIAPNRRVTAWTYDGQLPGTEIRVSASVARIMTMGGAATGVVLASGEEISARRIVSGASPRHTFLELCDPSQLAPEFVSAVRNVRYRGVWAKVNLAVERMPAFSDTHCPAPAYREPPCGDAKAVAEEWRRSARV